jgi:hypothetical protein
MAGERDNHGPAMTLTYAVNEIKQLQAKVTTMDQEKANKEDNHEEDEINDSQPLAQALWDAVRLFDRCNFKSNVQVYTVKFATSNKKKYRSHKDCDKGISFQS